MTRIQKLDTGVRNILPICLGPCGKEEWIVLAPNRQQRRLRLSEIVVKSWIEFHIRGVIAKQVELNIFIPWTLQQSSIQHVGFGRNGLRIAHAVRVLPARS